LVNVSPPELVFQKLHNWCEIGWFPHHVSIRDGGIINFKDFEIKKYARKARNDLASLLKIKIKGLPTQPLLEHFTPDRPVKDEIRIPGGKLIPFSPRGFEDLQFHNHSSDSEW
jgi:hypothetical protein